MPEIKSVEIIFHKKKYIHLIWTLAFCRTANSYRVLAVGVVVEQNSESREVKGLSGTRVHHFAIVSNLFLVLEKNEVLGFDQSLKNVA